MSFLTFDEHGFGTAARHIPWNELLTVGARTTGDGPFGEDVFWEFWLREGRIEVPGSMLESVEPLQKFLPGFDSMKVIKLMASCEENVFRLWHHEESLGRPNASALCARFAELVKRLGARTAKDETHGSDEIFGDLWDVWCGAARHYHDLEHLTDCLGEVDRLPPGEQRDLVELALWYHDAIYVPGASDNEKRSASLLAANAAKLRISDSLARRAAALVEATAHGARAIVSDEAAIVCDIDLAILGRDPLRFMEFEYGVEREFAAMSTFAFRRGRGRFLKNLLKGPIYHTAPFRKRFEEAARTNVTVLLASHRYRAYRWLRWLWRD